MPGLISTSTPPVTGNAAPVNSSLETASSQALSANDSGGQQSFEDTLDSMVNDLARPSKSPVNALIGQDLATQLPNESSSAEGNLLPLLGNSLPAPLASVATLESRSEDPAVLTTQSASPDVLTNSAIANTQLAQLVASAPIATTQPAQRGFDIFSSGSRMSKPSLSDGQASAAVLAGATQAMNRQTAMPADVVSIVQNNVTVVNKEVLTAADNNIFKVPSQAENLASTAFANDIAYHTGSATTLGLQSVATNSLTSIQTPVQQPGFGEEMGQRILWMVKNDIQTADIKINPPHLGPIEVRVTVNNDQTTITFNTPHVAVKEALDLAMPRLRELFGDNNPITTNVNVSHQSLGDQRGQHTGNQSSSSAYPSSTVTDADGGSEDILERNGGWVSLGLVDYFA